MSQNSTNGRAVPLAWQMRAAALTVAATVAPDATARWVADRFSTPLRPRGAGRPAPGAGTLPPDAEAWETDGIAGWSVGRGAPVLLAHGWSGDAADMAPLAVALARGGFRAVAFDMPAHGRSAGRRTTVQDMTRAILAVGADLGPLAAVVAHSLGGAAAVLALRDGLRADAAVLLAPPRRPDPYLAGFMRAVGVPATFAPRVRREMERRVGPLECYDAARAAVALSLPGLILHDAEDRHVPVAEGAAIAAAWARASLGVLEGVGHRRILRDEAVLDLVVRFVRAGAPRVLGALPPSARMLEPALPLAS